MLFGGKSYQSILQKVLYTIPYLYYQVLQSTRYYLLYIYIYIKSFHTDTHINNRNETHQNVNSGTSELCDPRCVCSLVFYISEYPIISAFSYCKWHEVFFTED